MSELLVAAILALVLMNVALAYLLFRRMKRAGGDGAAADSAAAFAGYFQQAREESARSARELREEVNGAQKSTAETMLKTLESMGNAQQQQLGTVALEIKQLSESNAAQLDKLRGGMDVQLERMGVGMGDKLEQMRTGMDSQMQKTRAGIDTQLETIRNSVDAKLKSIQDGNDKKLEQMRATVDEKLHSTLEKRLGESFSLVGRQLEAVQRGLGEMQSLATGVGDLKRVLTNVKTRGTWGEVQLGAILEQILTPDQYATNVKTHDDTGEIVEYAIKLPGQDDRLDEHVWLPIDAKFPQEDYVRLVEASERADADGVKLARADLIRAVERAARDIQEKYLNPPKTTDFAILFLPTEGLYAEMLREPGLVEKMQCTYRVVIAGPTTLSAIVNSLRMGFRTLAIEQRSSEVWQVLAAVKTEFGKFGDVLAKVKKQLHTAESTIGQTEVRTRAMERKLRDVEELPVDTAAAMLRLPVDEEDGAAVDNAVADEIELDDGVVDKV